MTLIELFFLKLLFILSVIGKIQQWLDWSSVGSNVVLGLLLLD